MDFAVLGPIAITRNLAFRTSSYRAFTHDVMAAILVSQNKGKAVILVQYQANPLKIKFYFYADIVFSFSKPTSLPGS